jgi:hypothetical protein
VSRAIAMDCGEIESYLSETNQTELHQNALPALNAKLVRLPENVRG